MQSPTLKYRRLGALFGACMTAVMLRGAAVGDSRWAVEGVSVTLTAVVQLVPSKATSPGSSRARLSSDSMSETVVSAAGALRSFSENVIGCTAPLLLHSCEGV